MTLSNGVATFSGLSYDKAETMISPSAPTRQLHVYRDEMSWSAPQAATQLVITQEPSATATAGMTFATQPVDQGRGHVRQRDHQRQHEHGDGGKGNAGTATLLGTTTVTLVSGVATFSGLSYQKAETMNITFSTTAGSFTSTSSSMVVSPAAASQLVITQEPSATATAGIGLRHAAEGFGGGPVRQRDYDG